MNIEQFARAAEFPAIWQERGLLTGHFFEKQAQEFEKEYGELQPEGGTEHWRYGSFLHWLRSGPEQVVLDSLLEAALQDPEPGMAGNVLLAIVSLPSCSARSFESALAAVRARSGFYVSPPELEAAYANGRP
jgi:hypothetical protein